MTKRTRLVIAAALVAVPVTTFSYVFLSPMIEARLRATSFESEKWKTKALDGDPMWPTRLRMVDDLVRSGELSGATREKVERLLGPPDDTPYFRNWSMVYWLGPERGWIRIDSEWLVLRLSQDGVVTDFKIVRD